MALLTSEQIKNLGLKVGINCKISDKASIYGAKNIEIGDNVRIDDFAVLSAGNNCKFKIGNYIHIAVYTSLIGSGNIILEDFVNFSSKVAVYSSNDDYSGLTMTSPLVDEEYKNVYTADVIIKKHSIIGCNSVIMPGTVLGKSCAIGALSFIPANSDLEDFGIYAGSPVKYIKRRSDKHLKLEKSFLNI